MLRLTKKQAEELIAYSKKEAPFEACGILAGEISPKEELNEVKKFYPMTNTKKSPSEFFMDSKEQFKVIKEIRRQGLEIVGIFHSHPQIQAYPSAHDVSLAFYPRTSYVIVSLQDKDNPSIRSFKIIEGKIEEEPVSYI